MRNTVNTGRTVVCTIHQPSIDIFEVRPHLLHHPSMGAGPPGIQCYESVGPAAPCSNALRGGLLAEKGDAQRPAEGSAAVWLWY